MFWQQDEEHVWVEIDIEEGGCRLFVPLAPLTLHRPVQGKKTVIRKVYNVIGEITESKTDTFPRESKLILSE